MDAKAQDLAAGSILFGIGVVSQVGGLIYGTPMLTPLAYLLMGSGFSIFLRGALSGILRGAGLLLTGIAFGGVVVSAFLLVTRRAIDTGFVMALVCMAALLTLAGTGLYRSVSERTETQPRRSRAPAPHQRTFK